MISRPDCRAQECRSRQQLDRATPCQRPAKCAEKFGEEAIEAIIEAVKGDRDKLTSEAADVLYHLLVMLTARDVTLAEVVAELARRQGTSGIDEKSARPS